MGATQAKGNLGVAAAIFSLEKQGIKCSVPLSESLTYDLIGDRMGVANSCKNSRKT